MPETQSMCGTCKQRDDAPKHQVYIGVTTANGQQYYHEHDFDRNGCVYYHFDCDAEWHDLRSRLAAEPFPSPDPNQPWLEWKEEQAAEHRAIVEVHEAIIAKCREGLQGDELRQWIMNMNLRGGAGGVDAAIANATLDAWGPNSATTTVGAKTITGPCHLRLMTANGSDTTTGTELATGSGYTAGGLAISFAVAGSASKASNASISWTNMPACTLTGVEEWDTSATPLRLLWGPFTGGNITVAAGNTFTVASGNLTNGLA